MSRILRFGLVIAALVVAAILLAEGRPPSTGRELQEGGPEATGSAALPPGPTPDSLSSGPGSGGASAIQTLETVSPSAVVPSTPIVVPIGKPPGQPTTGSDGVTPPVGETDSEGN